MLWALPEPPPASDGAVALWQQFLPDGAPHGTYSLPQEVHLDRDRLRASYLAWLHEVGQRPRRGRTLRDRLQIRPGLSYWWMTIPADFSLEPDSPAYRAVRLMAFGALAERLGARAVTVASRDRWLTRAVTDWAKATGRTVTCVRDIGGEHAARDTRAGGFRQALYRAVPPVAAARVLASMVRAPKHGSGREGRAGIGGITFIDYLAHLGTSARVDGEFTSNYWGPLVPLLEELDEPVSWLHISGEFATPAVVRADEQVVRAFNASGGRQVHDLLHSHLTWGVVARSCRDYARILGLGLRAGDRRRLFDDTSTRLSFWPLFQDSYRDQFYGRTAMLNCLWLNLLEQVLTDLPHQRLGIYLFENQPWEMAFQHAWRAAGHGSLVGFAHTTALFWSTRLFKDPRDMWDTTSPHPMPWPDVVATNGPAMRRMCEDAGWPSTRLAHVEAVRFFSLLHPAASPPPSPRLQVLVLGEFSEVATLQLLDKVRIALDLAPVTADVSFRPHPVSRTTSAPDARIRTDRQPSVSSSIAACDIGVCGSMSSVALEAACQGRSTVLVADASAFISSPAEGLPGVQTVLTTSELASALLAATTRAAPAGHLVGEVFDLNPSLIGWQSLICKRFSISDGSRSSSPTLSRNPKPNTEGSDP